MAHNPPGTPGRMAAGNDDPWVSVSVLGEHVFCPRAAIVASEKQEEDTGDEPFFALGRVSGTLYDLRLIKKRLGRTALALLLLAVIGLVAFLFRDAVVGLITVPLVGLAVVIAYGFLVLWQLKELGVLLLMYVQTLVLLTRVPNENLAEQQKVHWWAMLAAGFSLQVPAEGFRDPRWRVVGKPWRILVHGDLRIPVFRKRLSRQGSPNDYRLFPSHLARIAAYCHLLEATTGGRSPYGIVLFGSTYGGLSVPNAPGARKLFHDALVGARGLLRQRDRAYAPPPGNTNRCKSCPYGRPDRFTGQSECGNRFTWVPPYEVKYRRRS